MNKIIHIIGGGTVFHIRNHFALCSPAYGRTARSLNELFKEKVLDRILRDQGEKMDVHLHLTKMAGGRVYETNEDISKLIDEIVADTKTKIVVMNAALCDYTGYVSSGPIPEVGKDVGRLDSKSNPEVTMTLLSSEKIVQKIRKKRKDIFLVAFKATCGASEQEQYLAGLNLLKTASCNLVLANDTKTRMNMIITPEEAKYSVTEHRWDALTELVDMSLLRSHLTFTQSTVVSAEGVPWDSQEIPATLRQVVDYCIGKHAYKPFKGSTVGHFACKLGAQEFLTSKRRTNFNDLAKIGLVRIKTDGPDTVLAYGGKPSVGGQSQRIVFNDHPEYDCIVHFHCPLKKAAKDYVPIRSQREFECGSHECGRNTSQGLKKIGNLSAVMLEQHGPNIVFNHSIDPKEVIDFIESNFALDEKTGGYVGE